MKRGLKLFLGLSIILTLLGDSTPSIIPDYLIRINDSSYEIEGREDLMGRNEYLNFLTADPKTGFLPPDIYQAELIFGEKLRLENAAFRNQELDIQSVGPTNVGGRTRAVAFDIRDENVLLAGGVSGGVWKSLDGGNTWVRKSNPNNRNGVTCIVQDTRPGMEDTWYHGTGEIVGNSARGGGAPFRGNGIFKSTDNGETWNPIASTQDGDPSVFNSQFQYIWNIELNPENLAEDEMLVAAFGGILRSIDGGETWEVVLGQSLFNLDESTDLNLSNASFYTSLERSTSNIFYATLSIEAASDEVSPEAGFYFSQNGINWTEITPPLETQYRRTVIGISPSNPDIAYFMVDSNPILILEHRLSLLGSPSRINGFDPIPRQIPESGLALGGIDTQGSYNMMIRVHPEDPNLVFVGATNLFRSTDGFRTQENIKWIGGYNPGGGSSVYIGHHPDQHDLLFLPSNPKVALSASDGGLIESQDIVADSVSWESKNNGFVTSQFFTIAQSKTPNDNTMLGGMQDNGTDLTTLGSESWQGVIGGDGGYAATTNDNFLWLASFQRGQTLRLTFNNSFEITSFGRVDPGRLVEQAGSLYLFINPFALDPNNQNRMFCAGGNHLYFHPNISQIPGGSQVPTSFGWSRVNDNPTNQNAQISAIDISLDSEKVYFGTRIGQLFRLDNADNQLQFDLVEIGSDILPDLSYVSSISINPEDNQHILIVYSNYSIPSIFESKDGGVTFEDVSGNLEENIDGSGNGPSIRWVEILPKNSGNLFLVGTSIGLFSSEELSGGETVWMKESEDVMGSSIVTMMDYRISDGQLAIATHGNGVFTTNIDDFKPVSITNATLNTLQIVSAYPNPFHESTQIVYSIPEDDVVRIDILSSGGALVNTVLWSRQYAGMNTVFWNGDTPSGSPLSDGIYFYRIMYRNQEKTGRLLLRR